MIDPFQELQQKLTECASEIIALTQRIESLHEVHDKELKELKKRFASLQTNYSRLKKQLDTKIEQMKSSNILNEENRRTIQNLENRDLFLKILLGTISLLLPLLLKKTKKDSPKPWKPNHKQNKS